MSSSTTAIAIDPSGNPSQTGSRTAAIAGLGYCLPTGRLTNHDLAKRIETSHGWIMSRVGISSRCIADPREATSGLAVTAARAALADARMTAAQLDLILCATATPDFLLPSTACCVQAALGAGNAAAMDVNSV